MFFTFFITRYCCQLHLCKIDSLVPRFIVVFLNKPWNLRATDRPVQLIEIQGLFTPSVRGSRSINTSFDAWKDIIDLHEYHFTHSAMMPELFLENGFQTHCKVSTQTLTFGMKKALVGNKNFMFNKNVHTQFKNNGAILVLQSTEPRQSYFVLFHSHIQ